MEKKSPIKIGIMSFAHMHAVAYAHCLQDLPEVEFAGIADDDAARAKKMGRQFKVKVFPKYEDMLASDIDAVIVCSESVNHRRHVVMAAQSEKHALCEKPLATNKHDAEAIIEVSKRSNTKLQVAFPCRYHSAFKRLKQVVDTGQIGSILAIKATNQGICPGGWFIDKSLAGGGAVMDHTVHVLDMMRCLIKAEATRVYAEISNRMCGGDIDDTGIISVDFANGAFATIDCSWSRPKHFPFWGNIKLEITGTAGTARMDMFAQKIDLISDKTGKYTYEYWGDDIEIAMVKAFVRSITEDTQVDITGDDGLKALQVALAAYESAETGRAVEFDH